MKKYVDWFVNYNNDKELKLGRTIEVKRFDKLKDARAFISEEMSGYITRREQQGDYPTNDDIKTSFVEYFGEFMPSAQECLVMKSRGLKFIPVP